MHAQNAKNGSQAFCKEEVEQSCPGASGARSAINVVR